MMWKLSRSKSKCSTKGFSEMNSLVSKRFSNFSFPYSLKQACSIIRLILILKAPMTLIWHLCTSRRSTPCSTNGLLFPTQKERTSTRSLAISRSQSQLQDQEMSRSSSMTKQAPTLMIKKSWCLPPSGKNTSNSSSVSSRLRNCPCWIHIRLERLMHMCRLPTWRRSSRPSQWLRPSKLRRLSSSRSSGYPFSGLSLLTDWCLRSMTSTRARTTRLLALWTSVSSNSSNLLHLLEKMECFSGSTSMAHL